MYFSEKGLPSVPGTTRPDMVPISTSSQQLAYDVCKYSGVARIFIQWGGGGALNFWTDKQKKKGGGEVLT